LSTGTTQHVTTGLTQLQQIDPSISLKPLGDIRLGANKRPSRRARTATWPHALRLRTPTS